MQTPSWLESAARALKENSPTVLSGIAVTGVVGTVILAVRATPEAMQKLHEARRAAWMSKEEGELIDDDHLIDLKTKVSVTWRLYAPAIASGVATIACIIGANAMGMRRNAATLAAYTLVDATFREYKEHVLAELTPAKAQKIDDKINIDRVERDQPTSTQIIITGNGEQRCYDPISGRYFSSDVEKIRQAANTIGTLVIREMYASQDEFYELLGLSSTLIGETMGWTVDNMLEIDFTAHLTEDGVPCLAMKYKRLPRLDFNKL